MNEIVLSSQSETDDDDVSLHCFTIAGLPFIVALLEKDDGTDDEEMKIQLSRSQLAALQAWIGEVLRTVENPITEPRQS